MARETGKPTLADMAAQLEREVVSQYSIEDGLAAIDEGRRGCGSSSPRQGW
jgi:hypothetical protein